MTLKDVLRGSNKIQFKRARSEYWTVKWVLQNLPDHFVNSLNVKRVVCRRALSWKRNTPFLCKPRRSFRMPGWSLVFEHFALVLTSYCTLFFKNRKMLGRCYLRRLLAARCRPMVDSWISWWELCDDPVNTLLLWFRIIVMYPSSIRRHYLFQKILCFKHITLFEFPANAMSRFFLIARYVLEPILNMFSCNSVCHE